MTESPFNLITEPWIRVRDGEGVRDVSLRECFAEAHVIRALAGEVATQDAAILRLLLAILHRSVADLPEYAVEVWRGLWAAPTLPLVAIDQYLDRVEGRFNLFDDVAPFLGSHDHQRRSQLAWLDLPIPRIPAGNVGELARTIGAQMAAIRAVGL